MKIYVLQTNLDNEKPDIKLYLDRQSAFCDLRELCEYAGAETDEADPGWDIVVDFEGGGFIELYEQDTED